VQWPVPPLSLPDGPGDASEAVQLFVDRARRVGPFVLTPAAAAAVADVCRHLDGLPLAIELAAARTKTLSVEHIAAELGDRFRLLVSTSRTAPRRQRTLRAAIDWSYDLLDPDERDLLGLVSVFDGGCSLAALEELAGATGLDPRATLDRLSGLVDKSLVVAQPAAEPEPRYDMLETIRAYGREQLGAAGRLDEVRAAHRAVVIALVEQAEEGLLRADHRRWLRRLEQERDNIWAALESAFDSGAWSDALRIVNPLWWFWSMADGRSDGRAWLDAALAGAAGEAELDPEVRVRALTALCYLAGQEGDHDRAVVAGEQALALSAELGDPWTTAWTKQAMALTLQLAGQHERAAPLLDDARAVMAATGDHWRVAGCDLARSARGILAGDLDLVDRASHDVLTEAGLAGYEPFVGWGHLLRGYVAEQHGDLAEALAAYDRALVSARGLDLVRDTAFALIQQGRVAGLAGDPERAEQAFHEAMALAEGADTGWFTALARVRLAELRRRQGDPDGADTLVGDVVDWAEQVDSAHGPAAFFVILGGDPRSLATAQLG
jgi:predicted ATPase